MIDWPSGFRLEDLARRHPRGAFDSGEPQVDAWLATGALQSQTKHLSLTRVLLDTADAIAGYYTLAMGQVEFSDLPPALAKGLPRRAVPVAVLAWLGVSTAHQGRGLGRLLLAQGLADCHQASLTFPFVAVVLNYISDAAKAFYLKFQFEQFPNDARRLFLTYNNLEAMMRV